MEERKEFLVYWRDDAWGVFATLEEAEAYASDNVISQPFSDDKFVVCVAVADVSAMREADDARVIRIVRARPSEASAVEVLRYMLSTWEARGIIRAGAFEAARAVLAASGPDPSEVVRAAMRETEAEEAARVGVAAKTNAPGTGPRWQAAVDAWLAASQRLNAARAERVAAVDAYRKAGGK